MARLGAQAARSSTPKPRGAAAAPQMRARLLHLFSPKLRTPTSQNRTPSKATSCSLKQKWGVGYRHPTPSQTRHRSCHRPSGPGGRIGAALGRAGGGERTPRVRAPAGIQPKGSRLPPKRWQDAAIVLGVGVRGGGFHQARVDGKAGGDGAARSCGAPGENGWRGWVRLGLRGNIQGGPPRSSPLTWSWKNSNRWAPELWTWRGQFCIKPSRVPSSTSTPSPAWKPWPSWAWGSGGSGRAQTAPEPPNAPSLEPTQVGRRKKNPKKNQNRLRFLPGDD